MILTRLGGLIDHRDPPYIIVYSQRDWTPHFISKQMTSSQSGYRSRHHVHIPIRSSVLACRL